ncbi:MAG TPA: DMT family transporter [Acetobacteraceae bacterium]
MLARLAPFGFVLLWSSSFVSSKTGLRDLSPLLFVAVRLSACGLILLALSVVLRRSWRPLGHGRWAHCAIAGVLINAGGLLAPHVGLTLAPAAHIALVQSLTPLLTAVLGVVWLHERLHRGQWMGLGLGVAGVGLVVGLAAFTSETRLEGLILAFVGVLCLVAGTLYFGRFCRSIPLLVGGAVQFLSAGAVSAICAATMETTRANWTHAAIAATAWNTLAVSLGGMALYYYMLARGSVAVTTANFYLVPGTAAVLAWVFLGERISLLAILGLIVASIGCWLVNGAPTRFGRRPALSAR